MRPDMKEVLKTRGRKGGGRNNTVRHYRRARVQEDDVGTRIPMRPTDDAYENKCHRKGWYPAPIRRYLHSRVGHPWDETFAECCATFPRNTKARSGGFPDWWVELNPQYIDGVPYLPVEKQWRDQPQMLSNGDLYVDPQGILREAPRAPAPVEPEYNICLLTINSLEYLVKSKKGIWFYMKYSLDYHKVMRQQRVYNHDKKEYEEKHIEVTVATHRSSQNSPSSNLFELMPYAHLNRARRESYNMTYWKQQYPEGYPYLIECHQLSKQEKKKWNL